MLGVFCGVGPRVRARLFSSVRFEGLGVWGVRV